MAENNDEKARRRRMQQAQTPYTPAPTTTSTTVPYRPPTRTPQAPSGIPPAPTTTTTVAPTTTTTVPASTVPPVVVSAPRETPKTEADYVAELANLDRLINSATRNVNESPALSEQQRTAVLNRQKLVARYISTLQEYVAAVGVQTYDAKTKSFGRSYKAPAQLAEIAKLLSDPNTAEQAVESVLPALGSVNVNAAKMPDQWVKPWSAVVVPSAKAATAEPTKTPAAVTETQPTAQTARAGAGAGGRATVTGGAKRRKLPANWEAKFREMFPGQAWYLDVDPAKYPDIKKIVQDAVINKAWETPESQARFLEQFKGSSFYKELQSTQKIRQVKSVVGDLGFDTVPFNQFLTKAMNLGWDGDTLRFEAYKEAFRKDDTGAYVNPTAVERVRKSNPYLQVANIGKAFFSTVSDDTVQQTLTGGMTNDDVVRQQRELAKTRYAHLAPLLDQGLSLQDIGDTFRTTASQILEKDANTIDMSQADYEVALNFGEPGQKRVMTNGEWERLLRTDRKYGWENTENAKAEARQFVDNMAKAFGRVM